MAKYAIISDLHGNIYALDHILEDISKHNVDDIICLGDLVAKYFHPAEVVDEVRKNCTIVIKGNCDDLVATNENYRFARGKLGLDRIEYLDNLPVTDQIKINKTILNFYHSNPHDLERIFNPLFNENSKTDASGRILDTNDYNQMFVGNDPQISVVGHTHQNYVGIEDNNSLNIFNDENLDNKTILIPDNKRAIVNVGSAGEHNHMIYNSEKDKYIPRIDYYLTYGIIDVDELSNKTNVEIIKVPYTQKQIEKVYIENWKPFITSGEVSEQPDDEKKIIDAINGDSLKI